MPPTDHKKSPQNETILQPNTTAPAPMVPALRGPSAVAAPQKRRWIWAFAGLAVAFLGGLAYTQFWMTPVPTVAVEIASMAPVTRVLGVNGRIAAVRSVDVRSEVTGRIDALIVDEGDAVEANQVLARIDANAQTAVVRQAVAGLDAALVTRQQAQQVYDRALSLEDNIAEAVVEADANALQSATQEVARQSAVLEQAQDALSNYTIRAAITGVVLSLDADAGQIVSPSVALLTLADLSNLVVKADVDEAYARQIVLNQAAVLLLSGETDNRDGHVSFVSNRVDIATGGLAIEITFDDPISAPVGLTVAINIIVDQRDAALTVPRSALQAGPEETGVFVINDGTARFQPLDIVDWPAARLIVTTGLVEGDMVITDAAGIVDGQAVAQGQP